MTAARLPVGAAAEHKRDYEETTQAASAATEPPPQAAAVEKKTAGRFKSSGARTTGKRRERNTPPARIETASRPVGHSRSLLRRARRSLSSLLSRSLVHLWSLFVSRMLTQARTARSVATTLSGTKRRPSRSSFGEVSASLHCAGVVGAAGLIRLAHGEPGCERVG